jgi:hypothetical protein
MVYNKRKKGKFITSSFLSSWMTRKWWLGVKEECFEKEKYNYPRNLERSRKRKAKLEWESERRREKERSLGKILTNQLLKYI